MELARDEVDTSSFSWKWEGAARTSEIGVEELWNREVGEVGESGLGERGCTREEMGRGVRSPSS